MQQHEYKKLFIKDISRESAANAIESHIKRHDSLEIIGHHGVGKTVLLNHPDFKKWQGIYLLGTAKTYQILAAIAGESVAKQGYEEHYRQKICNSQGGRVIFIDEGHHLTDSIWKYSKSIIDTGNTFVIAGLPELHEKLKNEFPDVLSRFTPVVIKQLDNDSLFSKYGHKFDRDAFDYICTQLNNTRQILTVAKNCLDYLAISQSAIVTEEIAAKYVEAYLV